MKTLITISLFLLMAFAQTGDATIVFTDIPGTEGVLGHFWGELTYSISTSTRTSAELIIELTNISPLDNGGFITAFAFNNPGDLISDVELTSTDHDFGLLGGPSFSNGIKTSPFGNFDIGARALTM